jgi:hypothetical protein
MAGISELQRFLRSAGGLDVDKADVRRFWEFVDARVDGVAVAGVTPPGPITGLQEQTRAFGMLESARRDPALAPRYGARRPPDDVTFGEETEDLPIEIFGGLGVAPARVFHVLDEHLENPASEVRDRAFELFRQLV